MLLLTRMPGDGRTAVRATETDEDGRPAGEPLVLAEEDLPGFVAGRAPDTRWAWSHTALWYPRLLAEGVRVTRCRDLRLCHAILRGSEFSSGSELARRAAGPWDAPAPRPQESEAGTLFEWDAGNGDRRLSRALEEDAVAELQRQQAALASATAPERLRILVDLESAGALVAEELRHAGLPWRRDLHDRMLESVLGPRPAPGERPAELERLAARLREQLGAPSLNPDSPGELLKALRHAGLNVTSTRAHELEEVRHPAIATLLDYRRRARLWTANGWAWQDAWVRDGRFHAEYVPGGVVTGRWAGHGGGVLQLPKAVRQAVVADPGWKLVVADAAQLEPRILAALSGDTAMMRAGAGRDLYDGIVAAGVVADRSHAKVAMLGAMYGATTGDSARLRPALARAYPRAIGLVDRAARIGEDGGVVTTLLGRSSPAPGTAWTRRQRDAAGEEERRRARAAARDHGRFTRNFIAQGTAAEWALCWMAYLRARLAAIGPTAARVESGPHLVYFLHDEVMVHTPAGSADRVAAAVADAAADAGRLLFPHAGEGFPVTVDVVDRYADAK